MAFSIEQLQEYTKQVQPTESLNAISRDSKGLWFKQNVVEHILTPRLGFVPANHVTGPDFSFELIGGDNRRRTVGLVVTLKENGVMEVRMAKENWKAFMIVYGVKVKDEIGYRWNFLEDCFQLRVLDPNRPPSPPNLPQPIIPAPLQPPQPIDLQLLRTLVSFNCLSFGSKTIMGFISKNFNSSIQCHINTTGLTSFEKHPTLSVISRVPSPCFSNFSCNTDITFKVTSKFMRDLNSFRIRRSTQHPDKFVMVTSTTEGETSRRYVRRVANEGRFMITWLSDCAVFLVEAGFLNLTLNYLSADSHSSFLKLEAKGEEIGFIVGDTSVSTSRVVLLSNIDGSVTVKLADLIKVTSSDFLSGQLRITLYFGHFIHIESDQGEQGKIEYVLRDAEYEM